MGECRRSRPSADRRSFAPLRSRSSRVCPEDLPVEGEPASAYRQGNGVRADAVLRGRLKHAAVFMSRHEKHRMSELGKKPSSQEKTAFGAKAGVRRKADVG